MKQSDSGGSARYTRKAMQAELLDAQTERELAVRWRDHGDSRALHRLVTAYLRLAVSIAARFRRYGAPMPDLIQEANIGLMKAAEKFDPDRGVRFSTYAMWWIKAQVQDFVMRNWSMVRTGSTSAQKSLFFNLRRARTQIEQKAGHGNLDKAAIRREIAAELRVPLRDVETMEARMAGGDFSLNVPQAGEDGREWQETLEDDGPGADELVGRRIDGARARHWLKDAFGVLSDREREIITARKLQGDPVTLETLGQRFNLSKERIRQLEGQALNKMRQCLVARHGSAPEELVSPG